MDTPLLDKRNYDDIIKEIKSMAPNFTREWNFDELDPDAGSAIFMVFAMQLKETVDILNKSLNNNFVSFLNMSGIGIQPPKPSGAFTVFTLTTDDKSVMLDKGTKLVLNGRENIIFETESPMEVVPVSVRKCFYGSDSGDRLIETKSDDFNMFDYERGNNVQLHEMYFVQENILNIEANADIMINFGYDKLTHRESEMLSVLIDKNAVNWEYWTESGWVIFEGVTLKRNRIVLSKRNDTPFAVNERFKARVIRAKLKEKNTDRVKNLYLNTVSMQSVKVGSDDGIVMTDRLFCNSKKISKEEMLPYGRTYNETDSFYIGCDEVFTKKRAKITVRFNMNFIEMGETKQPEKIKWKPVMKRSDFDTEEPLITTISKIVWYYYNGIRWEPLMTNSQAKELFFCRLDREEMKSLMDSISEDIKNVREGKEGKEVKYRTIRKNVESVLDFTCPEDMANVEVGGESGLFIKGEIEKIENYYVYQSVNIVPEIESITLKYDYRGVFLHLDKFYTANNNQIRDMTYSVSQGGEKTVPFYGLNVRENVFYMCMTKPPINGPVNILFLIEKADAGKNAVNMKVEYLTRKKGDEYWTEMKIKDDTQNLTVTGVVTFSGITNFVKKEMFETEGFWIRFILVEEKPTVRKIKNIYFNGVWAMQRCSVEEEYPEYDAEREKYMLFFTPIAEAELWVNEFDSMSKYEIVAMKIEHKYECMEVADEMGLMKEFWVKWIPIETMINMSPEDRTYIIDKISGEITFGDNVRGKKPPDKKGIIKVRYTYGGGENGNVSSGDINMMYSSKAFIGNVFNPEPSYGGTDCETVEKALQRGTQRIRNKGDGISAKDIENIILWNYPIIYDVKCLTNADWDFSYREGSINVVVLNKGRVDKGLPPVLKKDVQRTLKDIVPSVIQDTGLHVSYVRPIRVNVKAVIICSQTDSPYEIKAEVEKNLVRFLDYVSGNIKGNGWKIGEVPKLNEIYAVIKDSTMKKDLQIDRFTVVYEDDSIIQPLEMQWDMVSVVKNAITVNGAHSINVVVGF